MDEVSGPSQCHCLFRRAINMNDCCNLVGLLRIYDQMTFLAVEPRNTLTLLYQETTTQVNLEAVDALCRYFGVGVG